ncbi:serine/threonine protein kinase [Candidatus Kaiserbacteria bacterium]|nr:serine/threonine protein kinase [Candidatus Kaiserbacteria bacterium]
MDADLQPIHDRVMQARRSEEIFDELTVVLPPRLLEQHLAPEMERMRAVLDETAYSSFDDREAARLARGRLEELYRDALIKSGKGHYVLDGFSFAPLPSGGKKIVVDGVTYSIGEVCHVGSHSSCYSGRMSVDHGSAPVIMRLAHAPDENPYLFNEIRMLDILHRQDVGYWRNVPYMLTRFNAGERIGIICRYFEGLTLAALREDPLHRAGLDQRHMVWVLDRMLGLLGYMHSIGVIHGHIDPDRIRIRPYNHNALLTGWQHAIYRPATTGERTAPLGGVFEAPEIGESNLVGPAADIYSLGKTLIWLIGGDPVTNEMPDRVEPKLRQFLLNMVPKNPRARPHDAWQLFKAQKRLKDSLWERRFIHLNLTQRS